MSEGTTPGKEEVELRQEQQPRAMQEQLPGRWKLEQRTTAWQGLFPTILLHFHRPWRSDAGRLQGRRR